MTHTERDILKLSEEQANKLDSNVMDAFYTKVQKMSKNPLGVFDEWDIVIYMLAKKYILHEHKDIEVLDMNKELKDLSEDIENAEKSFDEIHKEYKETKQKYRLMSNGIDKADVIEAHTKMANALKKIFDYLEDLFRDLYSCSECEEERSELKTFIKNLAVEYKIIN